MLPAFEGLFTGFTRENHKRQRRFRLIIPLLVKNSELARYILARGSPVRANGPQDLIADGAVWWTRYPLSNHQNYWQLIVI